MAVDISNSAVHPNKHLNWRSQLIIVTFLYNLPAIKGSDGLVKYVHVSNSLELVF